ncbi:TetR/AcrR family transcriptional regulator [Amycolatopsis sp. NPDC059657]|uniref:TetR/AcrR family transcriptional regulator n=1 Tax=Amycolatopsis sp. NPDC059657 TaxID=3346899 RepID=UPI00366C5671
MRGRPREDGIDGAVRRAVKELLAEAGYAKCTVDAIAGRAGVGKAALYRRWRSKAELVFAAVVHDDAMAGPADTGALQGDVAEVLAVIKSSLDGPGVREALPGLVADLRADPNLLAGFGERFIGRERAYLIEMLDRAVARGELARRPDPVAVHAILLGTVHTWIHLLGEPMGPVRALAPALTAAIRTLGS